MHTFTIKDLENLSGIKAHTIRIWEQRYTFLKPSRTGSNIRVYSNDELKTVLNVALLNKYGFKISHIDRMGINEIKEKILTLNQTEAQQERIVNSLIEYMINLDIENFEKLLDGFIATRGIEKTITQIIFPYLEKIGILWVTSHINPAQEHLVSNIIRQKLIVGIQHLNNPVSINKTVLLFLPEGEHHELGLLFVNYILKSKGINSIYLGCSTSNNDVFYVDGVKKPDYLFTHITTCGIKFNLEKFINEIGKKANKTPIIISGQLTQSYTRKTTPTIIFKKSFAEVMQFINSLAY